ncbi:MAG: MmgE/PrpD family protein [Bacteroidota bacterium]
MDKKFQTQKIAGFCLNKKFGDIQLSTVDQLKRHLLDSLGSFLYATTGLSIHKIVRQLKQIGEGGFCKAPYFERLPLDRTAQFYTALIRYPDFMDNYMGKEATCHPSDNIGGLLAACWSRPISGKEFLTAMGVAYQLECRLVEEIPVMIEGIDHTLLLGLSLTGGLARLMNLSAEQTTHALGICGTSISPAVTSRASYTPEWKGFASSLDALNCVNIVLLAKEGVTGPVALFEGPKGFKEVFDMKLDYDWSKETFDLIPRCVLKQYNAEVHSQSVLEGIIELKRAHQFSTDDIQEVNITTFLTAYHIIGSGAYGDRQEVYTKEQADHSLFYLAAVALIDGDVYPGQFEPDRIQKPDVQELLKKVSVRTGFPLHKPTKIAGILDPYTEAYPEKMKAKIEIRLHNGDIFKSEKEDYHGFHTRPFTWGDTIEKFYRLVDGKTEPGTAKKIIEIVKSLDEVPDMLLLNNLLCQISESNNQSTRV